MTTNNRRIRWKLIEKALLAIESSLSDSRLDGMLVLSNRIFLVTCPQALMAPSAHQAPLIDGSFIMFRVSVHKSVNY